jgi:KDO2-lipid IV(A) lauroyltransferase
MRRLTDWLIYFVVRLFVCIVQAVRIETCHSLAKVLAVVACDVVRLRHDVTQDNLRHVFPEWTGRQRLNLTRQMWEHLFLMVCEIAHVPRKIHLTNFRRYIDLPRKRELVRYLVEPRPIVLVTGHFGNFEVAGYMAGLFGFPTFTIARTLDNPYLDRFVNKFRGANGQFILPKQGSAPYVEAILKSGGALSLLADQHAGPKGCWVEFLGRPASCHKALALFTLTSKAPLVVCYAKRTTGPLRFELSLVESADPLRWDESLSGVKPLTQWYNRKLEKLILDAPEQYWWVHRRWKSPPPKRGRSAPPPVPDNAAGGQSAPRRVA